MSHNVNLVLAGVIVEVQILIKEVGEKLKNVVIF